MAEAAHIRPEVGRDRDRIVNLSDGVFAIAITLLILDIRVPDIPENLVTSELPGQLFSLWPKYLIYFLSFGGISTFWMIHHSIFRPITDYDRPLLYLNFLWYSTRDDRLLGEAQDPRTVRFFLIRGLTIPATFLLSIGISFFSVSAAVWSWLVMLAVDAVIVRRRLSQ
jgi:hypothetical protein